MTGYIYEPISLVDAQKAGNSHAEEFGHAVEVWSYLTAPEPTGGWNCTECEAGASGRATRVVENMEQP